MSRIHPGKPERAANAIYPELPPHLGRCRSPRVVPGLVFLAVAWADCYAPNLAPADAGFGARLFVALRSPEAVGLCLYHAALLSAVLAAALIELDGHPIP